MPSLIGTWDEFDGIIVSIRVGISRQELLRLRRAHLAIAAPGEFKALIDTGAQISCIDSAIPIPLGLSMFGVTPVNVPALGGLTAAVQYSASLIVVYPSGLQADHFVISDLPLTEVNLNALGYQVLLGRDVITSWTLHADGPGLTFSIDY